MNNFKIVISAVDRATGVVKKINDQFSRLTRPINNIGRSTAALGRELGLPKFAKNVGAVGRGVNDVVDKLFSLRTLVAGSAIGGGLLAIESLATGWGRAGQEIGRTSRTIGVSTSFLQSARGAAQAFGLSAEDLTSGIKSLGDTMEDALYGRNQQALAVMGKLGIRAHQAADGTIDVARAFDDVARAISRVKSPQVQGLVARTFGVESLLPLLREGPKAIAEYRKKVAELGGVMSDEQVHRAEKFGLSLHFLGISAEGLRNTIGDKLIPVLGPMVEGLTRWISANRELIATEVVAFVKGLAKWVKETDFKKIGNDIVSTLGGVAKFVEMIGGAKIAALGLAAALLGPLITSIGRLGIAMTAFALTPGGMILTALAGAGLLGYAVGSMLGSPGYDDTHRPPAPEPEKRDRARGNPALNLLKKQSSVGDGAATAAGAEKVQVEVNFRNAPPGTRVNVRASPGVDASGRLAMPLPAGAS